MQQITFSVPFYRGQTKSTPNVFLLYSYRFLSSYPWSAIILCKVGKRNTEGEGEGEVKEIYILLS